jgi:hypothetical protein
MLGAAAADCPIGATLFAGPDVRSWADHAARRAWRPRRQTVAACRWKAFAATLVGCDENSDAMGMAHHAFELQTHANVTAARMT